MATITERTRANGSKAYFSQVRVRRHGKIVHTESRTFDRRRDAEVWGRRREEEVKALGDQVHLLKGRKKTLGDAIDRTIAESTRDIGKTKAQVLRAIKTYDIAALPCAAITSIDLVDLARQLSVERTPQTVANYLSHLSPVFEIARAAWGYPLDPDAYRDACKVCRRLGLIGKSIKRDRRPTVGEMNALMEHFERRSAARHGVVPMHWICAIAMFSTRRQEELTRIAWADLDRLGERQLVRDMKHPGDKMGNDRWCALPDPVPALLDALDATGPLILPYGADAISAGFTRACKALGITDLRFHDLRHEGVSRVFEMGYTVPQAADVSGHRSWSSLERYTHLRQQGDKWSGWEWIGRLAGSD